MSFLRLNNVEVKFMNVIWVLKGVSLEIEQGAVVVLLGGNGTGKSTTLKAISGLLRNQDGRVTDGTIEFEGKRIENRNPEDVARMGIIQAMQGRRVIQHLTVEENLRAGAYYVGRSDAELKLQMDKVYSYFPRLKDLRNQMSGYLSGGEQQMLVVGRALMARPKLMLVDEPSLGLAPILIEEIHRLLARINEEEKVTLLVVEQNVLAALSVADHGYVMEDGRIVLDDTADKLIDNPDLREFYMGLSADGTSIDYRKVKHYERRKRWLS